jgi:hypothetical protein
MTAVSGLEMHEEGGGGDVSKAKVRVSEGTKVAGVNGL